MYTIIYIKRHTGILNIELRYTYILYTDRISYFCKKISSRKGKKGQDDIHWSFICYDEEGRCRSRSARCSRYCISSWRHCVFPFVVTMNEHHRNLETALTERSLRPNFVLDASKNWCFGFLGEIGLYNENIIAQKYFIILE